MDVSSLSSVASYASNKAMVDAKEGAALKTFKMAVDQQADMALQLVQSVDPSNAASSVGNLGQNVNVRV